MRMLFVASALPSHFFAMAPYAWAARAAGHDVFVAAQPALCAAVAASGLPVVAVGRPMDFAADYRGGRAAAGSADPKALFVQVAEDMLAPLVRFAGRWRPDVVIWEPTSFAGPITAAAVGVPSMRYLWGPDIVGRGGSGRDRMPVEIRDMFAGYGTDFDGVPEWTTIDPCPPSLQVPTSAPWRHVRYVPHSTAGSVAPELLRPPVRPRVVVTLGMSVTGLTGAGAFLAPTVVRALAGIDADVVVALTGAAAAEFEAIGDLPPNARIVSDCPLPVLLAGASAVVHHGGAGTLLSAIRAGVPQLILSPMPDLAFYGDRLAATGAGTRLAADADDAAIAEAVTALRERPGFAVAAERLRDEAHHQPTPAQLVTELAAPATLSHDPRSAR